MKKIDANSYWANIYVGFREISHGKLHTIEEAKDIAQAYCNEIGYCVTITPTSFIYNRGREEGCIVGLINYPVFPESISKLLSHAEKLAIIFQDEFKQYRISVVSPASTFMIQKDENEF